MLASVLGFGLDGWIWGATLLVGVLGNILWAHYRSRIQTRARTGVRARTNGIQMIARLGWAMLLAILSRFTGQTDQALAAYVGAVAAATADTWATEVGMLSLQRPRLIVLRRRVAAGTPGAVSLLGSVAALGGAWLVGLAALAFTVLRAVLLESGLWNRDLAWLPLSAALGGMAGCLLDSFLGATAQAYYHCEHCDAYSETPTHTCGRPANPVRGWPWLTNEGVNLVGTALGAAVSAILFAGLARSGVPW